LHIDHGQNKTIGDLSARLGLAYSTTTDLVDRMERREFVERVKDDDDKRMVRVRPLAKGQELIEQVMAARREYVAAILKNVSNEERDSVLAALQLLSKHLGD
ncbi:MAG: MarR family transcriptional regulator, partial [Firmicutes bacterium]|nr:MarR family transcriptional regulator [Bacillota bacterium]